MNKKIIENTDARTRILKVAARIFAEKGYDGARVDEIAREAQVNKALIYYYFKNKENIRDELFNAFIQDTIDMLDDSIEDLIHLGSPEKMKDFFDAYVTSWEDKKDVLRIMMMESLKVSNESPALFNFMDILLRDEYEKVVRIVEKHGLKVNPDRMEGLVADFFTGLLPIFHYVLYKDQWISHYDISAEELYDRFYCAFSVTHLNYHKVVMSRMVTESNK